MMFRYVTVLSWVFRGLPAFASEPELPKLHEVTVCKHIQTLSIRCRVQLLVTLLICLGTFATPTYADNNWIVSRMRNFIQQDVTWEQVRSQMLTGFYQSNPDESGVSAQGTDALRKVAVAQRRSRSIAQILNYDLDGDGSVTREEVTTAMQPRARQVIHANGVQLQPTSQQVRQQLDKLVSDILKLDSDHDGIISGAEIQQEAFRQAEQADVAWQRSANQFVPLTLDANGDGVVSLAEYEEAVRKYFDSIDQDHDGRISTAELVTFTGRLNEVERVQQRLSKEALRKQNQEAAASGCNVPSAPRDARFIFVGGGQGRALSNAWIGSPDRVTDVITVEVSPGPDPIYLAFATNGATIWDVRGSTDRIVGLVAHSNTAAERSGDGRGRGKPLVGVMGVPRDKIHFTAYTGCLVPPTKSTLEDGSAQEAAALLLGRAADEIDGKVSAGTFVLPAGPHLADQPVRNPIPLPKDGPGELLWLAALGDYPQGVAKIDVESVISPLPVKNYSNLPGKAGLAELVDAGALVITGTSRVIRLNYGDHQPFIDASKFKIVKKLRMPAGASGDFVLADQVPPPDGDLGNICVSSERDKKPIEGSRANCH